MQLPRFALAALLALGTIGAAEAADAPKAWKKCKSCHVTDSAKHKIGPSLQGVMGRKCGAAAGFKYAKGYVAACDASGFVIDAAFLDAYLTNPSKHLKSLGGGKSKMTTKVKKAEDRQALIEFLSQ